MTLLLLLAAIVVLGALLWLGRQRGPYRTRQVMALWIVFTVVAAHLIARLTFPQGPWWLPWGLGLGIGVLTALRWSTSPGNTTDASR